MKNYDLFISTYKELESLLDCPVREYEDQLDDNSSQKLRMCRYVRNYIQHNADFQSFIEISNGMISFLTSLIYQIKIREGIVKDHTTSLKKFGVVYETNTVFEAAQILFKKGHDKSPVLDTSNHPIAFVSKTIISDIIANGNITNTTKISKFLEMLEKDTFMTCADTLPVNDAIQIAQKNNASYILALNTKSAVSGILKVSTL